MLRFSSRQLEKFGEKYVNYLEKKEKKTLNAVSKLDKRSFRDCLSWLMYLFSDEPHKMASKIIRAGNFVRKDDINFSLKSTLYKTLDIFCISSRVCDTNWGIF